MAYIKNITNLPRMLPKMAGNSPSLLVIILAISVLISLSDLPTSRAILLLHESQAIPPPEDTLQMNKAENLKESLEMVESEFTHSRMDFEINTDYIVSGANNRHTPNPPVKN
ncbi:hypothetical protein Pfo_023995 [Paulownia fortunei]|nr:hypothetical protein Pfo_023995 [Paulownia fortunei]